MRCNTMSSKIKRQWLFTALLFILFAVFTALAAGVDVGNIGPEGSAVGFATLNSKARSAIGESGFWYRYTEVLGIAALGFGAGFAVFGLIRLISGRSIKAVGGDILMLGGFYVLLGIAYVLFEKVIINYRPVLEDGELTASYPSSHTVLIVGIMLTAAFQLYGRLKNGLGRVSAIVCVLLAVSGAVGRLFSGVHWLTDIIGGVLLAGALVMLYISAVNTSGGISGSDGDLQKK